MVNSNHLLSQQRTCLNFRSSIIKMALSLPQLGCHRSAKRFTPDISVMTTPDLLTVHLFTAEARLAGTALSRLQERLGRDGIRLHTHSQAASPPQHPAEGPVVLVSLGGNAGEFPGLWGLPLADRRRWLHVNSVDQITVEGLVYCWLAATDPLPEPRPVPTTGLSKIPLVSVFTACYRPGKRIRRPYHSLLGQTYRHWEWVVADDTGDGGTGLREVLGPLQDQRVRLFVSTRHSGHIGTMKRLAATLCQGEILVELDHDDALTTDCLERLVAAFTRHPEAGFAFGEAAEIYEQTGASHWYGWDAGFGFLSYWCQIDDPAGRVVSVPRTPGINWHTVRHLVGLPNHPRAWTRRAYFAAGGHRTGLPVADDYDLILRSLLCTQAVRVPHLLYLQYRNHGGENQTFVRNRQIQILCAQLERYYRPRIQARLISLGLPTLEGLPYQRLWTCPTDDPRWASMEICDQEDPGKVSHLFIYAFDAGPADTSRLLQIITQCTESGWHGCEVVVVGRVPEGLLEAAARRAPPGAVRWWTTEESWPAADIERYGRLLCTGKRRLACEPAEVAQTRPAGAWRVPLQYVEDYSPTAPADRGRDRLSVLLSLREQFGYRRYLEIGTDRDEVFAQMNGFDLKVGVDPNAGGTHRMTSDAYFAANRALREDQRERFDLVLIDGLHEYEQVVRDVDHALECLLPGGTIVLHDCMPFEEHQQMVPRPQPLGFWTGDVWKAVFVLRQRPDLDIAVGCFDWGVGVLRVRPSSKPLKGLLGTAAEWTWQDYLMVRDDGLNAMDFDALQRWIERRDRDQVASD